MRIRLYDVKATVIPFGSDMRFEKRFVAIGVDEESVHIIGLEGLERDHQDVALLSTRSEAI